MPGFRREYEAWIEANRRCRKNGRKAGWRGTGRPRPRNARRVIGPGWGAGGGGCGKSVSVRLREALRLYHKNVSRHTNAWALHIVRAIRTACPPPAEAVGAVVAGHPDRTRNATGPSATHHHARARSTARLHRERPVPHTHVTLFHPCTLHLQAAARPQHRTSAIW